MTRIIVRCLLWDAWNLKHIEKHLVRKDEVEIAVENLIYHRKTYDGRYLLVGKCGSKLLAIVLKRQIKTEYYVITARTASKKERRKVYEKEKNK